jgi:hypothetical protein
MDECDQALALCIEQLGGGILEKLGEVELISDAREDRAGFGSGFEPCL